MPANSPIALILGAGSRIGQSVGRAFAAQGYKVALAARSLNEEDSTSDELHIRGDFSDLKSVSSVFDRVKSQFGHPHVVVYNAAAVTPHNGEDPLGLPLENFSRDLAINTTSAFVAAQEAVASFSQLPDSASRTFIYTGNITNVAPIAGLLDLGVGKAASANFIQVAADAYKTKGYRFYYADERKPDGSPVYGGIDGPAHGKLYTDLASDASQGPWQQTFVKGVGYQKF